jgi:hypothetical protein
MFGVTTGAINKLVRMPDNQRGPGTRVRPVVQVLKIMPEQQLNKLYYWVSDKFRQSSVLQ